MDGPDEALAGPVSEFWANVIADAEATAEAYADSGWEALALHPGDVTPLAGEHAGRVGFDVLVPDDEFAALLDTTGDAEVDAYEVYETTRDGVVFLAVAATDADAAVAVVVPLYYLPDDPAVEALRRRADTDGVVRTHVRPLAEDRIVTFTHDEPALLFPG